MTVKNFDKYRLKREKHWLTNIKCFFVKLVQRFILLVHFLILVLFLFLSLFLFFSFPQTGENVEQAFQDVATKLVNMHPSNNGGNRSSQRGSSGYNNNNNSSSSNKQTIKIKKNQTNKSSNQCRC